MAQSKPGGNAALARQLAGQFDTKFEKLCARLAEGIRFERRTFQALFATHDQKEGMAAFVEKRPPRFEDR